MAGAISFTLSQCLSFHSGVSQLSVPSLAQAWAQAFREVRLISWMERAFMMCGTSKRLHWLSIHGKRQRHRLNVLNLSTATSLSLHSRL